MQELRSPINVKLMDETALLYEQSRYPTTENILRHWENSELIQESLPIHTLASIIQHARIAKNGLHLFSFLFICYFFNLFSILKLRLESNVTSQVTVSASFPLTTILYGSAYWKVSE